MSSNEAPRDLPYDLDHFFERPSMWIIRPTFHGATAYLLGIDVVTCGGLLAGFQEWVIMKSGGPPNFAWPGLLEGMILPDTDDPDEHLRGLRDHGPLIARLGQEFKEFYLERKRDGLKAIFLRYQEWHEKEYWPSIEADLNDEAIDDSN